MNFPILVMEEGRWVTEGKVKQLALGMEEIFRCTVFAILLDAGGLPLDWVRLLGLGLGLVERDYHLTPSGCCYVASREIRFAILLGSSRCLY